MKLRRVLKKISRIPQIISNYRYREIYLVADRANWILDWIGHYIALSLQEQHNISVHIGGNIHELRNQIIHFINRFAYLNHKMFRKLHPSNYCFLNWFHGDPNSSDPESQRAFNALIESVPYTQKIVVSCQITKQSLLDLGISEKKLVMLPLGVDLAKFLPPNPEERSYIRAKLGIPERAFCIGLFQKDGEGRGEGNEPKLRKGPDVFLEVIKKLSLRYNHLFVLLTGPARGYVRHGLENIGVPYLHHILPEYYDIIPYYHALDLYIIPARFEGGPSSLLESWATGIPLISTKVGIPADLIKHGVNGMLAEVEDIETLTEHAAALIEDTVLREHCRQQSLEDVKQYDWPLIAEQYYRKLYQPLLPGRREE
jgi:glycosyltransferase involved in cell wall biosynthesis